MNLLELTKKFKMESHEEGGLIAENHYLNKGTERAQSGSAYYYVYPNTPSKFHKLDCDEYWTYHAGDNLEIWIINLDGNLEIKNLGLEGDAVPCIFVERGRIFATRHRKNCKKGTLVSNITVPRFNQSGITLYEKKEIITINPDCKKFFE